MKSWLVAALVLCACRSEADATAGRPARPAAPAKVTDVTAQDYVMPALPHARVTLVDAYGYKHAVDAEVAATRDARTRGLMWRTSLAEGVGMLFIFPTEEPLTFWMKNTLIPLDMIFISKDRVIVGIVAEAEPKTLTSRGPGADAKYVLEVPSGWSAKLGLRAGLQVQLDGIQGLVPTE
jgi:uncharacterized membrane protein (UPF0127 family)